MPVLTEADVRGAAQAEYRSRGRLSESFSNFAERDAGEHEKTARVRSSFDIFLSHSFDDRELVLGLRNILEKKGLAVYVDWLDDPGLSRTSVSATTAAVIRERMKRSGSLLYASSRAAANSKWMPWELGYFDGLKGRVGVIPVAPGSIRPATADRQEYLGLYPYVGPCKSRSVTPDLCVFDGQGRSVRLEEWTTGARTLALG